MFVKTPGLSPVKTRLAASIGKAAAEKFHSLSAKAVASIVSETSHPNGLLTPYWAVAEEEAMESPHWSEFPTIWQGEGGLGDRLSRVYDKLIKHHSFVILIGADSPHITSCLLHKSAAALSQAEGNFFVLGRAHDGGFYLFGGAVPLPRQVWLDIPYSVGTTASELARRVGAIGNLYELRSLLDVDTVEDMARLPSACVPPVELTPQQQTLMKWIVEFFKN